MTTEAVTQNTQEVEAAFARLGLPSIQEIEANLDAGRTLPNKMYYDPEIAALEHKYIFDKSWHYACHESELQKPGDFFSIQAGRTPIMIVRQRNGELKAFVNACRHRLHNVVEDSGNAKLFQCPYHGWTYDLDGKLKNAPRASREPNFNCDGITLIPVSVEQWHQWIYVNPDADASPLKDIVAPVETMAQAMNDDLKEYEYQTRLSYTMNANWKLWAENAVECYHCPTMHAHSFGQAYDVSPDEYQIGVEGLNIWNWGPLEWLPDGLSNEDTKGFRFLYTFPGSFFALDDFVGFVGSVYPTSPTTCEAFVDLYQRPGADPEVFAAYEKMWDQTLIEDKQATDHQQPGYESDMIPTGHLMLDSEVTIQGFMKAVLNSFKEV